MKEIQMEQELQKILKNMNIDGWYPNIDCLEWKYEVNPINNAAWEYSLFLNHLMDIINHTCKSEDEIYFPKKFAIKKRLKNIYKKCLKDKINVNTDIDDITVFTEKEVLTFKRDFTKRIKILLEMIEAFNIKSTQAEKQHFINTHKNSLGLLKEEDLDDEDYPI